MNAGLSRAHILRLFRIDLVEGRLFWRAPSKYHSEKTGMEAGGPRRSRNNKSYWVVRIEGKVYGRGHLIFCAINGYWATPCLDHKNGNSLDDRPSNLREATVLQNAWNHKGRRKSSSLPMGVRVMPKSGRFQARISYRGQQLHLGAFDTAEEARRVYLQKRKELYREFA